MGLIKNNQKGFTLVEVMITAAIMGAMAMYFTRYFSDQMKQQKTVMLKMEEGNLVNEMRVLLMNVDNCTHTFKGQRLALQTDGKAKLEDPIDFLAKAFILVKEVKEGEEEKEPEVTIVEKYNRIDEEKKAVRYGQGLLKISEYGFSFTKDDLKNIKKFKRGDIEFAVTLDRGNGAFGNQLKTYKIPLEIEIDKKDKISSCSSMGLPAGGEAGTMALDSKTSPALKGKTGEQACRSKNRSCAFVQSTNYLLTSTAGLDTSYYAHSCTSSYNLSLQGIKNGGGLSNIHSCEAKIGIFNTFTLPIGKGEMTCAGTFVAICN